MARLPRKLQNGEQFKASTVYTINEIITYLESVRLSGDKRTIRLQEHATGITISAIAPPSPRSVSGGPATGAELMILNSVPSIGAGPGTATPAVIDENGDIVATGQPVPVVIPRIYHLNVE